MALEGRVEVEQDEEVEEEQHEEDVQEEVQELKAAAGFRRGAQVVLAREEVQMEEARGGGVPMLTLGMSGAAIPV